MFVNLTLACLMLSVPDRADCMAQLDNAVALHNAFCAESPEAYNREMSQRIEMWYLLLGEDICGCGGCYREVTLRELLEAGAIASQCRVTEPRVQGWPAGIAVRIDK